MKKIVLVLGIATLLFASCGSSPSSTKTSKEPDLTGVTSYYVRADGDDSNAGMSEDKPFKTLAKAVTTAAKTKVKTITVIGKLDTGEIVIKDSGTDEILITGKPDASDSEKAVLTVADLSDKGVNTIQITGNSNIKLEYLTVNTGSYLANIYADDDKVKLTLGKNAVISGNGKDAKSLANGGGGILMLKGTLIMMDNSTVTNCMAQFGGAIVVGNDGKMIMQDNAVISNNYAIQSGGGIFLRGGTLELHNNAIIKGNTAMDNGLYGGGGIYSEGGGAIKLFDNSSLTGNTAPEGGGIYMRQSSMQTADGVKIESSGVYESRQVSGNKATTKEPFFKGKMAHNICVMNY